MLILIEKCRREGFRVCASTGKSRDRFPAPLRKTFKHDLDLVIDRLDPARVSIQRVSSSGDLALQWGRNTFIVLDQTREELVSTQARCLEHDFSAPALTPQLFSFNSPQGFCPECYGLGTVSFLSERLLAPNPQLSLAHRAIAALPENWWKRLRLDFGAVMRRYALMRTRRCRLTPAARQALFHAMRNRFCRCHDAFGAHGALWRLFSESLSGFRETRLARNAKAHGSTPWLGCDRARKSIVDIENMRAQEALEWFSSLDFSTSEAPSASR
jgi:excinuclease ABC subunit A